MTLIPISINEPGAIYRGPVMLASGHRPFFLLAGLWAAGAPLLWLLGWAGLLPLASVWHGHEMVFGFAGAAIAGFLMAAVPKWTNRPPITGWRVALLAALWLVGRIGMAVPGLGWLDLVFLPVLAGLILADIVRMRNRRNYVVPAMLFGLAGMNAFFHFGDAALALRLAVYLVTAMIALIGGRIVPAFTQSGLRMAGIAIDTTAPLWLDRLAVPAVIVVIAAELLAPASSLSGLAALAAALILGGRMAGWGTFKSGAVPLVWILHAGYAWVPLGYALKAGADLAGLFPGGAALHALSAGAIGTMIIAVASRAALGHSGRKLEAARPLVAAYLLVIGGALLRVFLPVDAGILAGGMLWSLGYGLFAWLYAPILIRPRIDGLPG